jgi:hypothetical protein
VAAADRRHEVREAARAWREAGAIAPDALAAIEAAHPDDRRRLGPVFRVLVFGFTVVVVSAVFGLFGLAVSGEGGMATLLTFWGLVLVAATELQIGPGRRRQGGTEAATAFLGASYLLFGLAWSLSRIAGVRGDAALTTALALAVLVCGAAAWRWGYSVFAVAAAGAAFFLAARTPAGRLLWIVGGAACAWLFARAGDSSALAPAHRRACRAMALVSLVFLYAGIHLGSWDGQLVEQIAGGHRDARPNGALRTISAAATAIVPLAVLAWGVRSRRRWLIAAGTAGIAASLVTLRAYVHVAPVWVVLIGGGACALALAAALRRFLESGPERERRGLTAEPLFEKAGGDGALELAVGAVSFTPAARPAEAPALEPGGGRYGGGGASGSY